MLVAAAGLLALPSGAKAATQIGETFAPTIGDPSGNTWLQPAGPGKQYVAPVAGVITRWSFEADGAPPEIKFKVGRPAPGADFTMAVDFTIVGESEFVTPDADMLNSYFIRIPVQAGDVIGLAGAAVTDGFWARPDGDYPYHVASGDVPVGTTETFDPSGNTQFDLSALLEPDCDKDGLGDQTQDSNLLSCGAAPVTPPTCKGERVNIVGTPGADEIVGTPGLDVIATFAGNDEVSALGGNDLVCGNNGADMIRGGPGNDVLKGNHGTDTLKGTGGNDILRGGKQNDTCFGGKGDDTFRSC